MVQMAKKWQDTGIKGHKGTIRNNRHITPFAHVTQFAPHTPYAKFTKIWYCFCNQGDWFKRNRYLGSNKKSYPQSVLCFVFHFYFIYLYGTLGTWKATYLWYVFDSLFIIVYNVLLWYENHDAWRLNYDCSS